MAAVIFTLSLAWRRRPAARRSCCSAYPAVALSRTASLDATIALTVAVMVATYSAGAHTRGRAAFVAALGVAGLVALTVVRASAGVQEPSDVVLPLSLFGGPWLAGVAIRERRDREAVLEERAAILERERVEQARTAVAEERARIAREMHDIVAHAMSVIILQAAARAGRCATTRGHADRAGRHRDDVAAGRWPRCASSSTYCATTTSATDAGAGPRRARRAGRSAA